MIAHFGRLARTDRVRRHHALEHATISVVTEWHPSVFLSGRSNARGFYVFGEIETDELRAAVDEAARRLRAGEAELAIHPRCGTNLAVAGVLSGVAAGMASQFGPRRNRLPYAILASLGALMLAPRFGTAAQRHMTTLADLGALEVEAVSRRRLPLLRGTAHWVKTRST